MKRPLYLLFLLHLATRLAFICWSGFYNNYDLHPDSYWLTEFGTRASQGDFSFELDRFIASPLFPALCGLFKYLFGSGWDTALVLFQLGLAALSGVFIYKTALLLFRRNSVSLLASGLYAVFPFTLWYTHTFSQESLFQSLFVFSFYFLVKALQQGRLRDMLFSALFFSGAYLTKSHILLFALCIPLLCWHYFRWKARTLVFSASYALVCLAASLPYGIYQWKRTGNYVLSSNGLGYFFFLANSEGMYRVVADPPRPGTEDYRRVRDIVWEVGYFNGNPRHYDSVMALPQHVKQKILLREGWEWIKSHPGKFAELKALDALYFLKPGVNRHYYSFRSWLWALLVSLPVYAGAYWALWRMARRERLNTLPALYLLLTMLVFSVVFYVQNRFRTITIEPVYLMYAAVAWEEWVRKWFRQRQ